MRYLVILNFVMLIVYLYLCIDHIIEYKKIASKSDFTKILIFMPKFLFFSQFLPVEGNAFACTLFAFCFLSLIFSFIRWIMVKKQQNKYDLFAKKNYVFSKLLFSTWKFRYCSRYDSSMTKELISK